jgi:hypothetical protein
MELRFKKHSEKSPTKRPCRMFLSVVSTSVGAMVSNISVQREMIYDVLFQAFHLRFLLIQSSRHVAAFVHSFMKSL